jgi:hypothetical protein
VPNTKPSVGEALSLDEIEYEEWLSPEDATFYIRLELNMVLSKKKVIQIAKRFNCISGKDEDIRIQRGPIVEVCRKIYFPDIPKGWKYVGLLVDTYGICRDTATQWIKDNKIAAQKFNIGLEEIWFASEKEFRQCVIRQRNRKHEPGRILDRRIVRKGRRQRKRNLVANRIDSSRPRGGSRKRDGA